MESTLALDTISSLLFKLMRKAKSLNCEVSFTNSRKTAFNTEMIIFVSPERSIENVYALSHEIGHLIDFINGDLEYDSWKNDMNYRITAEMRAWAHSYTILKEIDAPMTGWHEHAQKKLKTYYDNEEI